MIELTHRNLCKKASSYLKAYGLYSFHRCQYVVCELERAGESPDAFGWSSHSTQLIEVKISRSDFLSDKKKYWRRHPGKGLGMCRSYLCPEGLINKEDLPESWGLLWIDKAGKITEKIKAKKQDHDIWAEIGLINSIMRREGILPRIFSYKKYKAELFT